MRGRAHLLRFRDSSPSRDRTALATTATVIEDMGRPRVEPCFLFEVVDHAIDSSGTNLVACLRLATAKRAQGERGCIVSLLCNHGDPFDGSIEKRANDVRPKRFNCASEWLPAGLIAMQHRLVSGSTGGAMMQRLRMRMRRARRGQVGG